jgi:hypothetical protein
MSVTSEAARSTRGNEKHSVQQQSCATGDKLTTDRLATKEDSQRLHDEHFHETACASDAQFVDALSGVATSACQVSSGA